MSMLDVRVFKSFDLRSQSTELDLETHPARQLAPERAKKIHKNGSLALPRYVRLTPPKNSFTWLSKYDLLINLNGSLFLTRYSNHYFGTFFAELEQHEDKTRIFLFHQLGNFALVGIEPDKREASLIIKSFVASHPTYAKIKPSQLNPKNLMYVLGAMDKNATKAFLTRISRMKQFKIRAFLGKAKPNEIKDLTLFGLLDERPLKEVLIMTEMGTHPYAYRKYPHVLSVTSEIHSFFYQFGLKVSLPQIAKAFRTKVTDERDFEGRVIKVVHIPIEELAQFEEKMKNESPNR